MHFNQIVITNLIKNIIIIVLLIIFLKIIETKLQGISLIN